MKNNFKLIIFAIFAIFWLSVSSAEQSDYLYFSSFESADEVLGCSVNMETGKPDNCFRNNDNAFNHTGVGNITTLTAFTGDHRYIYGDATGILYVAGTRGLARCFIAGPSGLVENCERSRYLKDMDILKMVVHSSKWLYYISSGSLGMCKLTNLRLGKHSAMPSDCHPILDGLRDATGLALSPNGKVVYITTNRSISGKRLAWLVACPVQEDGIVSSCKINKTSQFTIPSGIAIAPEGDHAYITDEGIGLKSCALRDNGFTLGNCNLYPSAKGFNSGAKSIALSKNGYYSYISYQDRNMIVHCKMEHGAYKDCKARDDGFQSPQDLAYFENIPNS